MELQTDELTQLDKKIKQAEKAINSHKSREDQLRKLGRIGFYHSTLQMLVTRLRDLEADKTRLLESQ